jgi:hypothetical protein
MRILRLITIIMLVAALVLPASAAQANNGVQVRMGHQWYEINWSNDRAIMHFTVFYHNTRGQAQQHRCQFVARKNVTDVIGVMWVTTVLKAHQHLTRHLKMKTGKGTVDGNDQSFHVYKGGCWRVWA